MGFKTHNKMNQNLDSSQIQFISDIKDTIRKTQYEALKSVNLYLINLYWELGKSISEKQLLGWGKSIVPTLSAELKKEFPDLSGFSTTNLWYMVQFFNEYQGDTNLQPLVGEISWTKRIVI
jgi:predicted nuclease of restriction endonuclease-like (RecB) superfamily